MQGAPKIPIIDISIRDVVEAGGVKSAIAKWCKTRDDTMCGVVGPLFTASGPELKWVMKNDEGEFAERAMEAGASYYVDIHDGHIAYMPRGSAGVDIAEEIEWTEDSRVRIQFPGREEAAENLRQAKELAWAVKEHHYDRNDAEQWRKLLESVDLT